MAIKNYRRIRRTPLVLGICMAMTTSAFAQTVTDQAAAPQDAAQPSEQAATDLDTVIVTGSRIRRAGFDTLEPATVVGKEYIAERGITNIADALNEIPGFGTGATPEGAQGGFGVGVNFVNRFGLGTNRTLTVVNGRRFVSSNPPTLFGPAAPGSQVDLNAIPTAMIERVENLAIGGSPTYGSDAVAGVVNVILRKNFEGVEFGTTFGATEQGDNHRLNLTAVTGSNFGPEDRGNVVFALSYDKADGVLQTERERTRNQYFFAPNPANTGPADGTPDNVLNINRRIWSTPYGGLISRADGLWYDPSIDDWAPFGFGPNNTVLAFNPNGELVPYDPGRVTGPVDASGGEGLSLGDAGQLTSDLERMNFNTTARYQLTDGMAMFFEGSLFSSEALELTSQWVYNAPLFGGDSYSITLPSTYALLTDQARATLAGLGVPAFNLARASRDLVTANGRSTTDLGRGVLGLEGDFLFADRNFYWEASVNYGRSDTQTFGTALDQQKFTNALHVVRNAQGQVVCAGAPVPGVNVPGGYSPIPDADCVPLDILGEGRPSEAARNYVTDRTSAQSLLEQEVFNVNISSTLIEMWSGPLMYNIGYERRKESGLFEPDAFLQAGLGRSVPITPMSGTFSTDEWFGEVIVPLVNPDSQIPGLRKLDLVGKYRSVDNTINGRAGTYTYGMQWKPIEDLELRGNFTQSIRAPSITELFLPQVSIFDFVTGDPCDNEYINGGTNPAVRQTNCQAFLNYYGLTEFESFADDASIQGVDGGNPNLDNETADSLTYGFTWAPSFLEGLTVTADYYKIEIDDVISSLNAEQIAEACFDSVDFNTSDVPNANPFCSRIIRNAPGSADPGQATTFVSGFVNGEYLHMEAYSAEVRYGFDTAAYGRFDLGFSGYFPKKLEENNTGVAADESVGEIGTSEKQYQFSGNWRGQKLGAGLQANYLSSVVYDLNDAPEQQDIMGLDSYWLLNGNVSYDFTDKMKVRLAVSNLLDEEPPFPSAGIGTYDILGRRYALSFEWRY